MKKAAILPCLLFLIVLFFYAETAHSRGWAVVVGIDNYNDERITSLTGADNDAIHLAQTFKDVFEIEDNHLFILTSNASDKDRLPKIGNILTKLEYIATKAIPEDTFVMAFSGHGNSTAGKTYLWTYLSQPGAIEYTALRVEILEENIKPIKADKKLLIFDICRKEPEKGKAGSSENLLTGDMVEGFRGLGSIGMDPVSKSRNKVTAKLFSCDIGQRSYEWPAKQRGFFSYFLEQGLKGEAIDEAGSVTLGGLQRYLEAAVSNRVKMELGVGKRQNPYVMMEGNDPGRWVLARLEARPKPESTIIPLPDTEYEIPLPPSPDETRKPAIIPGERPKVALKGDGAISFVSRQDGIDVRLTTPSGARFKVFSLSENSPRTLKNLAVKLDKAYGWLDIHSTPPNASVSRLDARGNAKGLGNTPVDEKAVPSGTYTLKITLSRYRTVQRKVTVRDNETTKISVTLPPAFGTLIIEGDPDGATVLLDQSPEGETPFEKEIDSGTYLLSLKKGDLYTPLSDRHVVIRDGEITRVPYRLPPNFGVLSLSSSPVGAAVIVDGIKQGKTPIDLKLSPGIRSVTVDKDEGRWIPETFDAVVVRGKTDAYHADLVRKKGGLNVFVSPEVLDATIWIQGEGKPRGVAPLTADNLETGEYTIVSKAQQRGRKLVGRRTAEVEWNIIKNVTIKLKPEGPDPTIVISAISYKMVYIKPGTFTMGSPSNESGHQNNERQHQVTLTKGFYMGATEVTQGQWRQIMGSNPSHFKQCGGNCPVEQVSWDDVQEFIRRLNERGGTEKYRLPTEAEWEYAARSGTRTPLSFGSCLSTGQANYDGNYPLKGCSKGQYRKRTVPVATFGTNAWGLYDMHGNVWEWVQDWYGDYPKGSVSDPAGPRRGSDRVIRGGGWSNSARGCRSANRDRYNPGHRDYFVGFRLARTH